MKEVIEKLKELKREEEGLEMGVPMEEPMGLEEMTSAGSSATGGSSGPFTAPLSCGCRRRCDRPIEAHLLTPAELARSLTRSSGHDGCGDHAADTALVGLRTRRG